MNSDINLCYDNNNSIQLQLIKRSEDDVEKQINDVFTMHILILFDTIKP